MMIKSCAAKIKAAGEAEGMNDGEFEAIVSVFDNVDSYGEVVRKGAFLKSLEEWSSSGDPIPIYYSHRMDDPDYNIGHVLEAKEVDKGLFIRGRLDVEADGTKARQVYRLLKGRRLTQFSFAYDVDDGGWIDAKGKADDDESDSDPMESDDGAKVYELRQLKLYEVGPTPIGANQETELLAVKHAAARIALDAKAGRVLSAKNEAALREARDALDSVLAALDRDDTETEKGKPTAAQPIPSVRHEEEPPVEVNSARANGTAPANRYLSLIRLAEAEID
jgi:uncharacterized protein